MEEIEEKWTKVERQNRNRIKIKKMKDKKLRKKMEVMKKARHMVGLGPMRLETVEIHLKIERNNYEKAKEKAVHEHLTRYYKYNTEELAAVKIAETKYNAKGDGIMYVALEDTEDIRDLYSRKADCKRDDTVLNNFVPPQIYHRFVALNKLCKERRDMNPKLKTQVRFGTTDLEIYITFKGEDDPFKSVPLEDFLGTEELPAYEEKIKWTRHRDRAPRRRVTSSRFGSPAGREQTTQKPADRNRQEKEGTTTTNLNENRSDNEEVDGTTKRKRKDTSMDSCSSQDLITAMETEKSATENADETL